MHQAQIIKHFQVLPDFAVKVKKKVNKHFRKHITHLETDLSNYPVYLQKWAKSFSKPCI